METKWSTVQRITGRDEEYAADVENQSGKHRLLTSNIERIEEAMELGGVMVGDSSPVALRVNTTNLAGRRVLLIQNQGATEIRVGTSSVSSSCGFIIYRGGSATFNLSENVTLYGISIGGDVPCCIMEVR